MKRVLMMLVAVALLVSFTAPAADAAQFGQKGHNKTKISHQVKFKDVKGHWAENVLLQMTAKGYLKGYEDASFKPSNNVSNLEAVVMIVRALGLEEEAKDAKLSLPVKHAKQIPTWAAGYVQVAYEEGILTAWDLASFNPNQKAKRIEVAQMITRALNLTENKNNQFAIKFLDQKDIPKNYTGIVVIMVQTGIMRGDNNNCFLPNKPITRAEMAVLLDRIDGKVKGKKDDEVTGKIKSVDEDEITIVSNGKSMEYDFSDEVMVYIDGKIGDVEDLKKGLFVKLILDRNDEVVFVKAENTDDDEFKGEISQIVLGKGAQFTIKTGSKEKTFKIDSDTEIEKDGKEIFINDLEIGWTVSVDVKKGVALKITVLEDEDEDNKAEKVKYKGTVRRVDADDATISIRGEKGNIYTFDVDEDAEITLDGASADLEDLKRGVEVEVVVIDDIAVKITAESSEEEFTGEIVAITLVGQDTVIIETDDDSEYVFDVTEDTIIRLNGKSADLDDLAKGDWVEIIARKGEALKIYAERDEK
ncbi:MAG: S-layer homology domain-containing protein [Bacillota bacterium]|jgi:hypothetical protein|nr:S-layer homology domain-containing protein [Clostridia bacterium]